MWCVDYMARPFQLWCYFECHRYDFKAIRIQEDLVFAQYPKHQHQISILTLSYVYCYTCASTSNTEGLETVSNYNSYMLNYSCIYFHLFFSFTELANFIIRHTSAVPSLKKSWSSGDSTLIKWNLAVGWLIPSIEIHR